MNFVLFPFPNFEFFHMTLSYQVLPDLLHTVRTCDDFLKEYIMWKLGTLVSIVRQVYIPVSSNVCQLP